MSNKKHSVLTDIAIGAVGGTIGTMLMNRASSVMYEREDLQTRQYEEKLRHNEYPPQALAGKVIKLATGREPATETKEKLALPIHMGLGAVAGALFGAMSRQVPAPTIAAGIGFGVLMWATLDEVGVPIAGLSPSSFRFPWQNHARALTNHVVYGATLGVTQALLRKAF